LLRDFIGAICLDFIFSFYVCAIPCHFTFLIVDLVAASMPKQILAFFRVLYHSLQHFVSYVVIHEFMNLSGSCLSYFAYNIFFKFLFIFLTMIYILSIVQSHELISSIRLCYLIHGYYFLLNYYVYFLGNLSICIRGIVQF
jgi:hypothetical protein